MTTEPRDWISELMADAAWTRRVAGALLGDASAAQDAVHDVWVNTHSKVPAHLADRRGWIRTLLANALRSRRRGDRRRVARERVSGEGDPVATAAASTPEELLGRLEVHRTLATLVAELEEPGRNVLLLHYYEGLTSAQIAAATGTPAATVRWRLKTALDRLRAQLDARYAEEKKDWRRALAPLLPAGWAVPAGPPSGPSGTPTAATHSGSGAPTAPTHSARGSAAALGVLLAGAVALLLVTLLRPGADAAREDPRTHLAGGLDRAERAAPAGGGTQRAGRAPAAGGPRGARPVALAAAAVARPCEDRIRALETDLAAARVALAYHLPARLAWADAAASGRNLAAERAVEPILARWLDGKGAPRAGRSLDCRHDACSLTVREPWPPKPLWSRREAPPATLAPLEARVRDLSFDGPKKRTDRAGAEEAEMQLWFRLHAPSGEPGAATTPPLGRSLLPSATLQPARRLDEPPVTAECRARTATLQDELERLRRRSMSVLSAPLLFRSESPNPALAVKLQAPLDRFVRANQSLPDGERPPALRAECRGGVCRVTAAEGVLREAVLRPLLKDEAFSAHVRRSSVFTTDGKAEDGLYVTVLPPTAEATSGEDVLRQFGKQLRRDAGAALCTQRFPPSGSLTVRFVVPAAGEVNEDGLPERISFRLTGPVAATPHGHCLAEHTDPPHRHLPRPPRHLPRRALPHHRAARVTVEVRVDNRAGPPDFIGTGSRHLQQVTGWGRRRRRVRVEVCERDARRSTGRHPAPSAGLGTEGRLRAARSPSPRASGSREG